MTKHMVITHFDEISYRTLYSILNHAQMERINHLGILTTITDKVADSFYWGYHIISS